MMSNDTSIKIGLLAANRGFFDAKLARQMRAEAIEALKGSGHEVVVPTAEMTAHGCVDSIQDAEACARLFRTKEVDGIVIAAVNFGSEQGAAWTVKKTDLNVPIMLFACQEEETLHRGAKRRDSFCGLLSIGEALRQIGATYSVPPFAVGYPREEAFRKNLEWFGAVCRVARGLRHARYGQIGARPDAFWTCRFDEKQLQRLGPTTVVLDLSELIAGVAGLRDEDPEVVDTLERVRAYGQTGAISGGALLKIAKLETFLRRWGTENAIDAFAIQCWTSIQQNLGVCSCATMSRFGEAGIPSACEADILGALSMHALQLAAGAPAALADWNNLHNEDEELVNLWHCGVFPRSFSKDEPALATHGILPEAGACPAEDAQGVVEMEVRPGPATLLRVTQDGGSWKALIAEGAFENNPAETFGSYGWCRIPRLLELYRCILLRHFPHHVAVTQAHVASALEEALGNYLGMQLYTPGKLSPSTEYLPLYNNK